MNKKEIGEIRRRMRRDRINMRAIYGCYVRDNQEIISEFKASMGMLPENEADKYMALFKRALGGSVGRTLNNIVFSTKQVASQAGQHGALMALRKCALDDEQQRKTFYQKVIESAQLNCSYVILLGCDSYDVPFKNKNDDMDSEASDEVFTYIICAICPVKETKPNLHYVHSESTFHDGGMMQAVNAPTLGFMFPAFDERSTNIYGALYFNKDTSDSHESFVDAIFGVPSPTPADAEKRSFGALLSSTLGDECSLDVIQAVHDQANLQVQMHEEAKCADPLVVGKSEVQSLLSAAGVSPDSVSAFGKAFDSSFGVGAEVNLQNIVDTKHYTVTAPDVVIKVAPEKAQDVEMREIGGRKYITILADEGTVEVNGIQVAM